MIRDLKMIGLALLALLAVGASAQGALASEFHSFTSAVEPTELTGSGGVHEWVLSEAAVLKCTSVTLTGVLATKSADELSLTPKYAGCKLNGVPMIFENRGCKTRYDSDTTPNPGTGKKDDAVVSLDCGHTGSLFFTTEGEQLSTSLHFFDTHPAEVPVNQELHGAKYSVVGPEVPSELSVEAHEFGLSFVCTGVCGIMGLATGTNKGATTIGSFTVKGYADATHTEQVSIGLSSP